MPLLQSTRPVCQITASQTPTSAGEKVLATISVTGAAAQEDPNSDFEQQQPYLSCSPYGERRRGFYSNKFTSAENDNMQP